LQIAREGVLDILRVEYDVASAGNALSDFPSLDSDAFFREVKKRRPKGSSLSLSGLRSLRTLFETEVPPILERRAAILVCEREIASVVHDAYDSLLMTSASTRNRPAPHAAGLVS
jgi:hypothetical protein